MRLADTMPRVHPAEHVRQFHHRRTHIRSSIVAESSPGRIEDVGTHRREHQINIEPQRNHPAETTPTRSASATAPT